MTRRSSFWLTILFAVSAWYALEGLRWLVPVVAEAMAAAGGVL